MTKWFVALCMVLGANWVGAADLQVRGMAAGCSACHGISGVALPGMDSLAGVDKEELAKKLMDFKSGVKPATLMHQISKGYSDAQIAQLATYFSALKK